MNREKILTILAVVAGGGFLILVGVGPVVYVYFNGFAGIKPSSIDGEEEWKRKAAEDAAFAAAREKLIHEEGLDARYTIHPFVDGWRAAIYERRDFEEVESKLAAQFSQRAEPYHAYLYSSNINELAGIGYSDDPAEMNDVLDEWVESHPTSHIAHMLRGRFHIYYGWYFRGMSHISKVSWKSREKFENQFQLARNDLHEAYALNPEDSEIFVGLLEIAYVLGDDRSEIDRYYQKAIALQPLSFQARIMRFRAALPQWRGSWEEVDALLAEIEPLFERFPLLEIVKLRAEGQMGKRGPAYEAALEGTDRQLAWAQPYMRQLERNPGDRLLMTQAAWYLTEGRSFKKAETLFREIGDHFYEVPDGNFYDVARYNHSRGYVYAARAYYRLDKSDGPDRAAEALAIAPEHSYTNHIYGVVLFRAGDAHEALPYLEKAAKLNPDYMWTQIMLVEVAEKLGRKEEALSRAQRLLEQELDPDFQKQLLAIVERVS